MTSLFHTKPNYHFLKTFGCCCYPCLRPYNSNKLSFRSIPCTFLGYSNQHKGYKCLSSDGRLYISRNVTFDELSFPFASKSSTKLIPTTTSPVTQHLPLLSQCPSQILSPAYQNVSPSSPLVLAPFASPTASDSTGISSPASVQDHLPVSLPNLSTQHSAPMTAPLVDSVTEAEPCANTKPPAAPIVTNTHPVTTRGKSGIFKPRVLTVTYDETEPPNAREAIKYPHWKQAMQLEYNALIANHTWDLVPSSSHQKIVGCKWVFKIKRNSDGSIARYKARLVDKGFHQSADVDYTETYSPVVKPVTIRVLLTLAVTHGWSVRQVDINNAFLHGILSETVFMEQPFGFERHLTPPLVCKLRKALYGLKQAPRACFDHLSQYLHTLGFVSSRADISLLIRKTNGDCCYILVYVDDIIITGSSTSVITALIKDLNSKFALKDLGPLSYFLEIEVSYPPSGGMFLS